VGFELTTLVVIGTDHGDGIGRRKSNYHTITTTMAPYRDDYIFEDNIEKTLNIWLVLYTRHKTAEDHHCKNNRNEYRNNKQCLKQIQIKKL
jgi:hypothetical protein